ncbi:MAG: FAD-dependent oxidoreductase, partial [Bacteroidia bacterium]
MKKVAVVGAGISGIMSAYYLAKKGHNVTVYDSERYPAMKTSFANGGQISVSNSETWTTMANVRKGIGWMFQKDSPLYIRPTLEWSKIKWLSKFMFYTVAGTQSRDTITSIHLGLRSRKLYENVRKAENIQYDYNPSGILHFYKDQHYFDNAKESQRIYEYANASREWNIVNTSDILKHEPTLRNAQGILGGVWTPDDYTGDIHKFCYELHHVLETKYNVKFVFNAHIDNITELAMFDNIVISNGVGVTKLAKSIGDKIPVYPVKGYSITIELDEESQLHAPNVSLLDDAAKIVTARMGNRLRVAGTAELCGENYDICMHRIKPLLDWVHTNLPKVNTHNYTPWACLRPMTPNMLPIVKQSTKNPKVFYHCGHGHLGWTYSPATAEQLAEML